MRMYVPEIGDRFRLTSDWTFDLYNEYRNKDVWDALGCEDNPEIAPRRARHDSAMKERQKLWDEKAVDTPYTRTGWSGSVYTHHINKLPPEYKAREDELLAIIQDNDYYGETVRVTLPKDTVLSVDRIYIRKGNSEFSSLTFYVHECPLPALTPAKKGGGFKKGKKRFWAKLADVNSIEFETLEEVQA